MSRVSVKVGQGQLMGGDENLDGGKYYLKTEGLWRLLNDESVGKTSASRWARMDFPQK